MFNVVENKPMLNAKMVLVPSGASWAATDYIVHLKVD